MAIHRQRGQLFVDPLHQFRAARLQRFGIYAQRVADQFVDVDHLDERGAAARERLLHRDDLLDVLDVAREGGRVVEKRTLLLRVRLREFAEVLGHQLAAPVGDEEVRQVRRVVVQELHRPLEPVQA